MLLFDYITLTTSQKQGRRREVGSGGSLRQTCELTDRNLIVRPSSRGKRAQHREAHCGSREYGK